MYRRQTRIVALGYLAMAGLTLLGAAAALWPTEVGRLLFAGAALAGGWALAVGLARGRLRLAAESLTDPLTGLYNRRYLFERLAEEVARTARYGGSLAVAMLDLDDFKRVNDTDGHLRGDAVLHEVGRHLVAHLRRPDLCFRYGGEEFVVLMPGTGGSGAAEGLLRLAETRLRGEAGGGQARLAFSAGIAACPEDAHTVEALLRTADARLAEAKRSGKGRVLWGEQEVLELVVGPTG